MLTVDVINLLKKLLERASLQSKSFDTYKVNFLKKIQNSPSQASTNALTQECLEELIATETPLQETLSDGRLLVSQSQLQIQKIPELPNAILDKLAQSKSTPRPYTIIEHHNELSEIVKLYQRVVNQLNNKNSSAVAVGDDQQIFYDFNEELLRLILSLDIDDAYLTKIKYIHHRMEEEKCLYKLPESCIRIMEIIIDSTREERRSSRHFLYTLNDNLTKFNLDFTENLKNADELLEEQSLCIKKMHKRVDRLEYEARQHTDFSSLQAGVISYIESIGYLTKAAEDEEKQAQILQKFHSMAREIKDLQNKTKHYQRTLKDQQKQLQTDFLTKIPNRAAWNERLLREYNRYRRYQHDLSIAIIDVDKFKKINDTFGHVAGDKVISVVALILQKSLRNTDFIARYGGDEFVVLFPETTIQQTRSILDKLCAKIRAIPFKFKKENISITISIGCTSFNEQDSIETAFERADQALFHAKDNGRDRFITFKEEQ